MIFVRCAGYLYNFQTKELYDLSYGHEPQGPTRFGGLYRTLFSQYVDLTHECFLNDVSELYTFQMPNCNELLQQQQQHSLFSQASWGRLEMKPERNKFKVQAH